MYVRKTRQYKEGFLRFGNKKISLRLVVKRRQKNRKSWSRKVAYLAYESNETCFILFIFFPGRSLFELHQYDKYELFVFS